MKRDFPACQLNRKWFGDGTLIPTDEGRWHLVSVLDVASRRVLGSPGQSPGPTAWAEARPTEPGTQ
jgi:transposase InsO family protein